MKIKVKAKLVKPEEIWISTEFIKLDAFLKFANIAESGGMAKAMIEDGAVKVNAQVCTQRGRKLRPGDEVEFDGRRYLVAGEKQEDVY